MLSTAEAATGFDESLSAAVAEISRVVYGKEQAVKLSLCCLLSRGHLLIEDLPGLGKTTLASAIGRVTGLEYRRVQFTSDMLPADLTGFSMLDRESGKFEFQRGPVFCQLLLADEINRSSPKTQSALLESMEERQVSIDGVSHPLPTPFFVIATQNPFSLAGTFPLPESQLDRFLMRISMGYPDSSDERRILSGSDPRSLMDDLGVVLDSTELVRLQELVSRVKTSDVVLDYVQRLIDATRVGGDFVHGISPRGGMALVQCSRAWALISGRDYVTPDDVQAVVAPVFGHRLTNRASGSQASLEMIKEWIQQVDVLGS
jgi:MoxR-like ATPase